MSKSGSALPFHTPWMLLQSKLNLKKAVVEQMKDALRHATFRNKFKGQRAAVTYIKEHGGILSSVI